MSNVHSSFINRIGYIATTRTALVEFKNGKTYAYCGVHPKTFQWWTRTRLSVGVYYNRNIKGRYPSSRVASA